MKGVRIERMAEELRALISEILQNRVSDPRLGLVVVTRVEPSRDMAHARVYVSFLGDEKTQEASLHVLAHAGGFVRHELARRAHLRHVPELVFQADPGIRYSFRLQQTLKELGLSGEAGGEEEQPETGGGPVEPPETGSGPVEQPETGSGPVSPPPADPDSGGDEEP